MSHPIEQRMAALRRRLRRLLLFRGLSATVAAVLAVAMLLALGDYVIRFQDRGIRILCWLGLLAAFGWTCRRYLIRPLRARSGDVNLAVRLERRFPVLEDRLISSVEFLRQAEDDPVAGSAALRRAVIAETAAVTEGLDFNAAISRGAPLRAGALALAVALAAAALAAMNPLGARIALARLINPWGDLAWPQAVVQSPPTLKSLRVALSPPAYTGWPEENSDRNIRALVGTRLRIEGTASKPLRAAVLCFEGRRRVAAALGGDRLTFVAGDEDQTPLLVEKSGDYWFELTDSDGLVGGVDDHGEITAVPDLPPSVIIERPTSNLVVTPQAIVSLRIRANDDLALRRVALAMTRSDRPQEPPAEILPPPYQGPERVEPAKVGGLSDEARPPQPMTLSYRWDLAELKLPPGSQVAFFATATDYHGQATKSEPRRLIVVTPEELQQRIAGRQELILAELARVLKMQREGRGPVTALEIRIRELRRLEPVDLDRLQAAELNQRQVNASLTSRADGIPMQVFTLLADLENNRLANAEVRGRMQTLLDEIARLDREHLTAIDHDLVAAAKSAQAPPAGEDRATAALLHSAGGHQDQVIAALEAILGRMSQWGSYRRFQHEVEQLLRDQELLAHEATEVGRLTLTKDLKDLRPQEAADLTVLAQRQLDLARRLDRLLQEMDAVGAQLKESDPAAENAGPANAAPANAAAEDAAAAQNIADAAEEARNLAIVAEMRAAAGGLQENQIGQAVCQHKELVENLQKVLDILAHRRRHELTGLVKKQQAAEAELEALQDREDELSRKLAAAARLADPAQRNAETERLAQDQDAVRAETRRMARLLVRILAEEAGRSADRAGDQMGQAGRQAAGGHAAAAAKQAAAAGKTLAEARRKLAAQRFANQAELALEQLARLDDAIKHFHRQEQNVIEETQRLDELQRTEGRLTRAQALSLHDLARLQESLHVDLARLAEQLKGAGAFSLALSSAAEAMAEAATMLDRRETAAPTQQAERKALARLALVLEALKPDKPDNQDNQGGGGQGNQGPPGSVRTIEELKMLKLLQQEVNLRTRQLHEAVGDRKTLTAPQRAEYPAVAAGQGGLADLVMQMLPPTAAAGLQRELGHAADSEDANPLLAIAQQMRLAEGRLAGKDAGPETQDIQDDIVAKIDNLLEQAKKCCQCAASSPPQQSNRPPSQPPKSPPQQPGSPKAPKNPVGKPDDPHKTNKPGQSDRKQRESVLSESRDWGKLQEQERQRLLQAFPEVFLPKYKEMIEDYYRRLSRGAGEEDTSPGDGGSTE
jgi:hypothetical protein